MAKFKALITTVPFADKDNLPLDLLEKSNIDYLINPLNKKLTEDELAEMVEDFDVIIDGTEKISKLVISKSKKLKHISRVGIGLDSVDLLAAREKGIKVSYTPDAPAPAVSELTMGIMFSLLRSTHIADSKIKNGDWNRFFGRRITKVKIGIIGFGRIGRGLKKLLDGVGVKSVLVNDLNKKQVPKSFWATKDRIYNEADVISLHLPLTNITKDLITKKELISMKKDALIINTSRGGIINERDLFEIMQSGHLGGAAIDVFENEPYNGPLKEIERCMLTAHMGSMSVDCRTRMEIEATKEAIRFLTGKRLQGEVPEEEYDVQRMGL